MEEEKKRKIIKWTILISALLILTDLIYKSVNNITYLNREKCIVNQFLPEIGFLIFEYVFELGLIVLVGIFVAVLLENFFTRFKKLYPKNPITAFLYASVLPVCACSVIPLLKSMKGKIRLRTLITFVVAAPLLSPIIIVLSFTVIDSYYAILRIVGSFFLAISAGIIVELFSKEKNITPKKTCQDCQKKQTPEKKDVYLDTWKIFKKIIPYLLIAAVLGIGIEMLAPADFLMGFEISKSIWSLLVVILIGIPIYFCNGAEVLFLRPLIHFSGLPLGTAIAFSLSSTAICVTSIVMLFKFLGKRLTIILTGYIVLATLLLGLLINFLV